MYWNASNNQFSFILDFWSIKQKQRFQTGSPLTDPTMAFSLFRILLLVCLVVALKVRLTMICNKNAKFLSIIPRLMVITWTQKKKKYDRYWTGLFRLWSPWKDYHQKIIKSHMPRRKLSAEDISRFLPEPRSIWPILRNTQGAPSL